MIRSRLPPIAASAADVVGRASVPLEGMTIVDDRIIDRALEHLRSRRGLDLFSYRRSTLRRRLSVRMAKAGVTDPADYPALLDEDPEEADRLLNTLLIGVSAFFREPIVFDLLERDVLPDLLVRRRAGRGSPGRGGIVRAWSAGCAGGEEAWSLAVVLHEAVLKSTGGVSALVFGTDLDPSAIERARDGIYPRELFADARRGRLDALFEPWGGGFRVGPELRAMVRFSVDDLTDSRRVAPADTVFGGLDLILCRNVLIYMQRSLQDRVLNKLVCALAPGGCLVLGATEVVPEPQRAALSVVDEKARIYSKRLDARLGRSST